jgi:hypothetical protein
LVFTGLGVGEEGGRVRATFWWRWERNSIVVLDVRFVKGIRELTVEETGYQEGLAFGWEEGREKPKTYANNQK